MNKKLPLFYYPPTICWVDDDSLFLNAANSLFKEEYNCLTFADPEIAIEFLRNYQSPYSNIHFLRQFTESDIYDTHDHLPVDINICEIAKLANTRLKKEIAILIIDNNMPLINGIEFCQTFRSTSYKKILLTGKTRPVEVINAFNNGLINKFIGKDQDVVEKLQENILELSYEYFYEKTKHLISHIEASRPSPLSDEVFIDFFHHWCKSNQCTEFYLINKYGSFLIKRKNGTASYFIVMSEHAIKEFCELNDDALDKVGNLLNQVAGGHYIPFFGIGKESWEFSYDDWNDHFYPSNVIHGREKYFWSIINKMEI